MNNQTVYWIWLQMGLGFCNGKIHEFTGKYSFAEDFYYDLKSGVDTGVHLRKNDINKLLSTSLEQASKLKDDCVRYGIDIISYADESYPEKLRKISNPPILLYIKGKKEVLSNLNSIAIVGPRKADNYGLKLAHTFSYDLASSGFTIISGGALGVDTTAHEGALKADGVSICVLGCGINYNYLRENDNMKKRLIERGALISEYPPYEPASRFTFPQRNRIVSALSRGVLIVEAAEKSGALITAKTAKEQGRDVFSVPGNIDSELSEGTNNLIKQGAVMTTSCNDILTFYGIKEVKKQTAPKLEEKADFVKNTAASKAVQINEIPKKKDVIPELSKERQDKLSDTAQTILKAFTKPDMHIDELVEVCGLDVSKINAGLTELEIFDCVSRKSGKEYIALAVIK